jgi:hypothetical protein
VQVASHADTAEVMRPISTPALIVLGALGGMLVTAVILVFPYLLSLDRMRVTRLQRGGLAVEH